MDIIKHYVNENTAMLTLVNKWPFVNADVSLLGTGMDKLTDDELVQLGLQAISDQALGTSKDRLLLAIAKEMLYSSSTQPTSFAAILEAVDGLVEGETYTNGSLTKILNPSYKPTGLGDDQWAFVVFNLPVTYQGESLDTLRTWATNGWLDIVNYSDLQRDRGEG